MNCWMLSRNKPLGIIKQLLDEVCSIVTSKKIFINQWFE